LEPFSELFFSVQSHMFWLQDIRLTEIHNFEKMVPAPSLGTWLDWLPTQRLPVESHFHSSWAHGRDDCNSWAIREYVYLYLSQLFHMWVVDSPSSVQIYTDICMSLAYYTEREEEWQGMTTWGWVLSGWWSIRLLLKWLHGCGNWPLNYASR